MNPLAIFTGPYAFLAKWGVIALLVGAFGAWSWFKGNEHGTRKLTEYKGKQAIEAVRIGAARERVTTQVITQYVKVAGKTEIVTNTITKEVKVYADANPGSCLDFGWRRLHDAAATNQLPDPRPPAPGPVRETPAAPAGSRPRVAEGGGGPGDGHLQLRSASSLRGHGG